MKLTTAQIGRCGELLVQYALLSRGVESAPMSTAAGIDLVAYSPASQNPYTIQVKTNLSAKPGGGKGAPALDWWVRSSSQGLAKNEAQLFSLFGLANLVIAKRRLLALDTRGAS
jgi:hypothetical protein